MRSLTVMIAAIFLSVPALAQLKADNFTLSNGMQVVAIKNSKVPAISHMVWYKVGSMDEPMGKTGIAHFFEHLMFKGTPKYPAGEFSRIIAKYGGNDNAFTGSDYTAYYQNISSSQLELVMDMESDRMQNLLFDEKEILTERNVVLEERRSRVENKPQKLLLEQMQATLFVNHPYARPTIGWHHEIAKLNLDDTKDWYKKFYSPSNAILVVSGDIELKKLKELAQKYYGSISSHTTPSRPKIEEPNYTTQKHVTLESKDVTTQELLHYYIAPNHNSVDHPQYSYPLIVLSYILGGGNTSVLYQELVNKQKLAASVSTAYDDLRLGPSVFSFRLVASGEHTPTQLNTQLDKAIDTFLREGFSDKELAIAKSNLEAQSIYAAEDLKTLAIIYGQTYAVGLDASYVENWQANIAAVTKEDVMQAAKFVLQKSKRVIGELTKPEAQQ